MLYLFAILLPPVALPPVGKPFQSLLSLIMMLTILGWIPAAIWAILVVDDHKADERAKRYGVPR
jgi:uncharacterized membrane protein YqaE (UPF0057 family)